MEKRHSVFFLQKASEEKSSSRVIFTLKICQAVGPMEDDKYQPCYIPTNNLQVASSLRGCFTELMFFFWEESNKNKIIQEVVFRGQKKNPFPALTGGSIVQETDAKLEEPMLWVDLWAE